MSKDYSIGVITNDIYTKEDYDNWKKEAQQYIQNIKKGIQTEEEFDKWLDKNK